MSFSSFSSKPQSNNSSTGATNLFSNFGSSLGNKSTTSASTGSSFGKTTGSGGLSGFGGFGSSSSKFSLGGKQDAVITESMTLEEVKKKQDESKEKNECIYAAVLLNDIINKSNGTQKNISPIEGADAFDKKLTSILDDAEHGLMHSMVTLANEIDNGNIAISEFRHELETSKRYLVVASNPVHSYQSPLLSRYIHSIEKQSEIINEAISSFDNILNHEEAQPNSQSIKELLRQQHDGIARCSTRISKLEQRANEIRSAVIMKFKRKGYETSDFESYNDVEMKSSIEKSINDEYNQFLQNRKRDLEKRETNADKFKKPAQQTGGLGGGSGFKFGGFGSNSGFGNKTGTGTTTGGFGSNNSFGNKTGTGATTSGFGNKTGTSTTSGTNNAFSFGKKN